MNRNKKGQFVKGHKPTIGMRKKMSKSHTGKKVFFSDKAKKNMSEARKGIKLSKKHKKNLSKSHIGIQAGEKNPRWKGDEAGYSAIHIWINKIKGKAKEHKCECGKQAEHWSNKKHNYTRNPDDYVARCKSCHKKFDIKNNGRNKILQPPTKIIGLKS